MWVYVRNFSVCWCLHPTIQHPWVGLWDNLGVLGMNCSQQHHLWYKIWWHHTSNYVCPYDPMWSEEATKAKTTINHDLAPIGQIKDSLAKGESSLGVAGLRFSERYLSNWEFMLLNIRPWTIQMRNATDHFLKGLHAIPKKPWCPFTFGIGVFNIWVKDYQQNMG